MVYAELLDSTGKVLLRVDPPSGGVVRVPPYSLGGKEGTLVRINPTREFLALCAQLERTTRHYSLRATIETPDGDANLSDNTKIKELGTSPSVTRG